MTRKGATPKRSWQPLGQATPYRNGLPAVETEGETTWKNDRYTVTRREAASTNPDITKPAVYLSIKRNDRKAARDWRDFQRIKNQLAGPEYEGAELYPAESRLMDEANQYHLFCFPFQLPFGYNERVVGTPEQADEIGAVQRELEEVDLQYGGITEHPPEAMTLRWPTVEQVAGAVK